MHNLFQKYRLLLLLAILATANTFSQTTTQVVVRDLETWSQIGIQKKLHDDFKLELYQGLRLYDNSSSIGQILTNFSGTYKQSKFISYSLGLRYIRNKDNSSGNFENHMRYYADFEIQHPWKRFDFNYRLRLQTRDEIGYSKSEGDYLRHVQRLKAGIRYNIKNWKLDPTVSAELFRNSGKYMLSSFDKLRFTLGTQYSIKNVGDIGFCYRLERELGGTYPKTTSIFDLSFTYKF